MKIVKYGLLVATMYLFSGCVGNNYNHAMTDYEKEVWLAEKSGRTPMSEEEFNKKIAQEKEQDRKIRAQEKQNYINRIEGYEKNYLSEYESLKKTFPQVNIKWIQPKNKKEPCKIFVSYLDEDYTKDDSYKLFWDGGCKNGYAHGLGREIEKADLINRWQIGIYRNGKPNGYGMQYNNLHDIVIEGEMNYDENKLDYQVHRKVFEKNGDVNIIYRSGAMGTPLLPNLYIETSPFWNNTLVSKKTYPNFYYQFRDFTKNDLSQLDFGFEIINSKTNQRDGWGYEKFKNQKIVNGEYIDGKPYREMGIPSNFLEETYKKYMTKADSIINEIRIANNKALEAQEHAQLIKKQYINKICKDSVRVSFMDNDEYKVVCNNQKEKTLYSKVQDKLERITKEKIAKLEQQRYSQQQAKEEQYRQQQLAIERQKMEQQRRQAAAAEEANNQRAWDSLNQSIQNMNTNMYRQNQNFQMWQLNNNLNNINNTLRAW